MTFPDWIKTFTADFRALVRRKATTEERCELIGRTEREQNLGANDLVRLFMAYVESPEGKIGAIL